MVEILCSSIGYGVILSGRDASGRWTYEAKQGLISPAGSRLTEHQSGFSSLFLAEKYASNEYNHRHKTYGNHPGYRFECLPEPIEND